MLLIRTALSLACAIGLSASALAQPGSTTLRFSPATSTASSSIRVTVGATVVNVPLPPLASATLKRDQVRTALAAAGHQVVNALPGGDSLTVLNTAPGSVVVETINSGERVDQVKGPAAPAGRVGFRPVLFDPFDAQAQPAVFTAGIVTDVGELTATVSAQELNFQTSGPIICQALFQRLAPQAPQYGAVIDYAGDRLEIYFDPAYSVTSGGVNFGTTSRTPGCSGRLDGRGSEHRNVILRSGASRSPVIETEILELRLVSSTPTITIPIPPLLPPPLVSQAVLAGINEAGVPVLPGPTPHEVRVFGFDASGSARVETGGTGQDNAAARGAGAGTGTAGFTGHFDPFDHSGQPAIFTAGIVTDVGELTARISSAELNFQTDGPIICQALFQRLAPRAPQYGSQILYAGDRLEIYFDPAYTVTTGGVVFGTTSRSPGCFGELFFQRFCRADLNRDGVVDFNDLLEYLNLYNAGDPRADRNADGVVDFNDLLEYLNLYNEVCP
ncbi:MAG: hypothetical protein FJ255_02695 [Phycisphaerae bacterium]|nr:hypothetical protein [Phycisphaerae bacterium]